MLNTKSYAEKRVAECIVDMLDFPEHAKLYEADLKRWLQFLNEMGE